jgi:hypothetical protein
VGSTVEDGSAFRTEKVRPAGRFTTFVMHAPARRVVVLSALPAVVAHDVWFRFACRQKVDRKRDRPDRLHLVLDFGRDRLGKAGAQYNLELGLGPSEKAQLPVVHDDPTPRASCDAVSPT